MMCFNCVYMFYMILFKIIIEILFSLIKLKCFFLFEIIWIIVLRNIICLWFVYVNYDNIFCENKIYWFFFWIDMDVLWLFVYNNL